MIEAAAHQVVDGLSGAKVAVVAHGADAAAGAGQSVGGLAGVAQQPWPAVAMQFEAHVGQHAAGGGAGSVT